MRCARSRTVIAPSPDPNGAPAEDILASAARVDASALGRESLTFENYVTPQATKFHYSMYLYIDYR